MPFGKRTFVIQVAFMLHNLCRAHDASPLRDFDVVTVRMRLSVLEKSARGRRRVDGGERASMCDGQ